MSLLRMHVGGTPLTPREVQVLRRIALGDSQIEAGKALGISKETTRKHMKSVRARLGAKTNAQAVAIGISLDLI